MQVRKTGGSLDSTRGGRTPRPKYQNAGGPVSSGLAVSSVSTAGSECTWRVRASKYPGRVPIMTLFLPSDRARPADTSPSQSGQVPRCPPTERKHRHRWAVSLAEAPADAVLSCSGLLPSVRPREPVTHVLSDLYGSFVPVCIPVPVPVPSWTSRRVQSSVEVRLYWQEAQSRDHVSELHRANWVAFPVPILVPDPVPDAHDRRWKWFSACVELEFVHSGDAVALIGWYFGLPLIVVLVQRWVLPPIPRGHSNVSTFPLSCGEELHMAYLVCLSLCPWAFCGSVATAFVGVGVSSSSSSSATTRPTFSSSTTLDCFGMQPSRPSGLPLQPPLPGTALGSAEPPAPSMFGGQNGLAS